MGQSSAVSPVLTPHQSLPPSSAAIYALTIFLSALLLFQVQLIMGKSILPWFGGMPAVWNTCMLVYQVLLLGGYAYAHLVSTRLGAKAQARLHLGVLAASLLVMLALGWVWRTPLTPGAGWKPQYGGDPVLQIVVLLGATIALPFFILSTTGPLLQAWFSRTHPGRSPYRLYALSNAGSLLGLLSYPFLVERRLRLPDQAWMWSAGYALFVLACGATAWRVARANPGVAASTPETVSGEPAPSLGRRLLWLLLATCASVMLLGTTNLLCQEIAVIPFLWVLPLCLYLLTFIICFENDRWYKRAVFHPLYAAALLGVLFALRLGPEGTMGPQLVGCSLALLASCMVCHGELVRLKPSSRHLTSFYLTVAAGGAMGGVFVVLVAPQLFKFFWEFKIALIASGALLLLALALDKSSWLHRAPAWAPGFVLLGVTLLPQIRTLMPVSWWRGLALQQGYIVAVSAAALGTLLLVHRSAKLGARGDSRLLLTTLVAALAVLGYAGYIQQAIWNKGFFAERNFFGVKSVIEDEFGLWLKHGATMHGMQVRDPRVHLEPTIYFKRKSGIGLLLDHYPRPAEGGLKVGVIGLGVGTLATYGRPGDYYRFYEIDPQVPAVSLGPKPYFTFLRDSKARWDLVMGDARLSLERELEQGQAQQFDIFVLDAFSSDAIPAHLLTKEAMELYLKHLKSPDSVLAFHISNRHVDLAPLLLRMAREYKLSFIMIQQLPYSQWVLMSANEDRVKVPESDKRGMAVAFKGDLPLWSDDFSNLFDVIRYR